MKTAKPPQLPKPAKAFAQVREFDANTLPRPIRILLQTWRHALDTEMLAAKAPNPLLLALAAQRRERRADALCGLLSSYQLAAKVKSEWEQENARPIKSKSRNTKRNA